ncbi:hypothetical protein [Sphingobium fluviale]|uniref:Uncharacterized protein n=1 Tax=Sphingobium fluviale TaxID=2506423 RepID=A0A4Q1KHF2_9SPHN|nr:hypothetical protein [Sphingobium fluviale]RXR29161.1 hypothetical protein EQG66_06605 [Sphingobium fluviale]
MDAKTVEWIIFGPAILALLLVSWWAMEESHRRLNDPNDDRTVYLDQLRHMLKLAPFGIYRVTLFRQSGNIHAEHIVTGTAQDALNEAVTTFRRAKIDAVHVGVNSETELQIGRLYHDHRGRNEGRKIGKAVLKLLERLEPANIQEPVAEAVLVSSVQTEKPKVTFENISIACDCGAQLDVPFDALDQTRLCVVCGNDATLTSTQVTEINEAALKLKKQALKRHQAGETNIQLEHSGKFSDTKPLLTAENIRYEAAHEAVMRLNYLTPDAIPTIISLMEGGMTDHPRAITTAYRKNGVQLSKEEKKALGVRANGFLSRKALDELTEVGRECPLVAHEKTLLRAMFSENRFKQATLCKLSTNLSDHLDGFKYSTLNPDCPFCRDVDGTVVRTEEVAILPHRDCICETANYLISAHFDWLKGV